MSERRAGESAPSEDAPDPGERFRRLPARIDLTETVESYDPFPAPDPVMGRDPEQDFVLRYAS